MSENRLLHFEIAVLQFENLLLVLQIYFWYSESIILYFEGIKSLLEVPRVDFPNSKTAISKCKSLFSDIRPLKCKNILSK